MKNKILYLLYGLLLIFKENQQGDIGEWDIFCEIVKKSMTFVVLGAAGILAYAEYDQYCLEQSPLENQIAHVEEMLKKPYWQEDKQQIKLKKWKARLEEKKAERDAKKNKDQQEEQKITKASGETTPHSQFPLGKDFKPTEKKEKEEVDSHFLAPMANGIPLGQNQSYSQFSRTLPMSFFPFTNTFSSRLGERLINITRLCSEMKQYMREIPSYNQQEGEYHSNNDYNPFTGL